MNFRAWTSWKLNKLNAALGCIGLISVFLYTFFDGLSTGAGWGIYEPIAAADRFWQSGSIYSSGLSDGYQFSTPYFPAVVVIAIATSWAGSAQDTLMIALGSLAVPALVIALFNAYRKLGGRGSFGFFSISVSAVSIFCMQSWLDYASEFKPDTWPLVLLLLLVAAIFYGNNKYRFLKIYLLTFGILMFKQQFFLLMLIVWLFEGFRSRWSIRSSPALIAIPLAMFSGLALILEIPGAFNYTVIAHIGRGSVSITTPEYLDFYAKVIAIVLIGLSVGNRRLLFNSKSKLNFPLIYLLLAISWFLIGIMGAQNVGGNIGNIEVGFVLFIPLIVNLFEPIRNPVIMTSIILVTTLLVPHAQNSFKEFSSRSQNEALIRNWMNNNIPDSILTTGDSYGAIRGLNFNKISEINVWDHLNLGILRNPMIKDGSNLIQNLKPEVILCSGAIGCDGYSSVGFEPGAEGYKLVEIEGLQTGQLWEKDPSSW